MSAPEAVDAPADDEAAGLGRQGRFVLIACAVLALVTVTGILAVFRFVESERQRDLRAWQVQLGIVADSRAAAVEEWLRGRYAVLQELAENPSLQLYLTELRLAGGDRTAVTEEGAQGEYLGNLLQFVAERSGFDLRAGSRVGANVRRPTPAGLAAVDPGGRPLIATAGMPPLQGALAGFAAGKGALEHGLLDIHVNGQGEPSIGFRVPVLALQGGDTADDIVGGVVGVQEVGAELFDRLRQPGEVQASAESLLVRIEGGTVAYLSPLADGSQPLERRLATDTPDLAAAALARNVGGFGEFVDYAGRPVLATSRAIAGTPWVLIRKVGRNEALAETDRRLGVMLAVLLLAIGVVLVTVIAVWRHGTSLRAAQAAERFRRSSERLQRLSRFLRVVADGQPTAIAVVDEAGRYSFANRRAAEQAGLAPDELVGQTLAGVLGPARARSYERINREVLHTGEPVTEREVLEQETGGERILRSDHIPLPGTGGERGSVLMVLEDVTELERARARQARTMRQLVDTLVTVVDRRDPWSANHSARVAEVAKAMAEEMALSPVEVATVDIAGALMNLGKILVPPEILTKAGALSEAEAQQVRDSILTSADLLQGIEFDGRVVETLRQLQEHWDGSGYPEGLQGEAILLTARIVAVANAFVGMTSARAWRAGLGFDEAEDELLKQAGGRFDRRPVAALLNLLDNRGGRTRWAHFGDPPAGERSDGASA